LIEKTGIHLNNSLSPIKFNKTLKNNSEKILKLANYKIDKNNNKLPLQNIGDSALNSNSKAFINICIPTISLNPE
jgi:hypothetical protein